MPITIQTESIQNANSNVDYHFHYHYHTLSSIRSTSTQPLRPTATTLMSMPMLWSERFAFVCVTFVVGRYRRPARHAIIPLFCLGDAH